MRETFSGETPSMIVKRAADANALALLQRRLHSRSVV